MGDDTYVSGGSLDDNPAATVGAPYPHTVEMNANCGNHDGGVMWVDYHLGHQFTEFASSIGLRDDTETHARVTYELLATYNGTTVRDLWTGSLIFGNSRSKDLNVRGVVRLRLMISDPSAIAQNCSATAWVVWGNPRVRSS